MNTIEVIILDKEENQSDSRSFESLKEAKQWVKECGMNRDYWNRSYERDTDYEGAARDNVHTLQLHKNGECIQDWFPDFK
jgi:hypothetical protein